MTLQRLENHISIFIFNSKKISFEKQQKLIFQSLHDVEKNKNLPTSKPRKSVEKIKFQKFLKNQKLKNENGVHFSFCYLKFEKCKLNL